MSCFSNRRFQLMTLIVGWGLIVAAANYAAAQALVDSPEVQMRWDCFRTHQKMRNESPFKDLSWQFVGPVTMTGRLTDIECHPSAPETIYVAGASGGVFKTTDNAKNWEAIFTDYPTASIGDMAIDPNHPEIIWVGTGEANILRSSMAGLGVYRSNDSGKTFEYTGLGDTHHIARIIVHPQDSNTVYVCAPGHEYTHNPQRGVFKTTDGGKNWSQIFYKDNTSGSIDLAMDPSNPDVLYMSTAERLRYRWNDPKPGPQTALWKSTDAGQHWFLIQNGLPHLADCERIGIDICRSQPQTVYALVNNLAPNADGRGVVGADLYRSNDAGATWSRCEGSSQIGRIYASYGWFFGQVRVAPDNPDVVYVLGVQLMRSTDGGKTFANVRGNHADYHSFWFNPTNAKHILVGNDGGIMISQDGLEKYEHPTNLPVAQLYNVAISQEEGKFAAYSCIQDNMGWRGEIDMTAGRKNVTYTEWQGGHGDESGRHAVDPGNPNLVYMVNRYGTGPFRMDLTVADRRNRRKEISPDFQGADRRGQWVSPLVMSPHDSKRLLYAAQFVFVTDNQGDEWRKISDDLTNYDPNKQGNIAFATIFSLSESPLKKGLIYAGTDDGLIQVTQDEGKTWNKIVEGLPKDCVVASIEACREKEGTVYVALNGKRLNDFNCYLFKSDDYGQTWTSITNNLPHSIANVIKQDLTNPDILYAGTDVGVYVSIDQGQTWAVLGKDLPTSYVHDITLHSKEHVAVIATHGRGAYLVDLLPVHAAAQFVESER